MPARTPETWFLRATDIPRRTPSFTDGNEVSAFIDGADYMSNLADALHHCNKGVYLAGWRVTGQQHLRPVSPKLTVVDGIRGTIPRGARIRSLVYHVTGVGWPGPLRFWHGADNRLFSETIRTAGQEALLDQRLSSRPMSSHHQKFIVLESTNPDANVAYAGGIDLCLDRWDTHAHNSPPERDRDLIEFYLSRQSTFAPLIPVWPVEAPTYVNSYLPSMPAWHDVQARIKGRAVKQILEIFTQRWNDSRPANHTPGLEQFRTAPATTPALPDPTHDPGTCWVQVLQTLPCQGVFPFAPGGEQTVLKALALAIDRAEHYIYIEDQYLWPSDLIPHLIGALQRNVHVLILVARDYDLPGMAAIHQGMRARVIAQLQAANPTHFRVFHLQRPAGDQIYVHAKTMVVDDVIAFIGSANINHRSMTNDTELHLSILDAAPLTVPMGGPSTEVGKFAHMYRRRLWAEHLGVEETEVMDPVASILTHWAAIPGANTRVRPHVSAVTAPDIPYLTKLIVTLVMQGGNLTAFPAPLPPPALGESAVQVAVGLALTTHLPLITTWLEEILNPRLACQ